MTGDTAEKESDAGGGGGDGLMELLEKLDRPDMLKVLSKGFCKNCESVLVERALAVKNRMDGDIFCYIHKGGQLERREGGQVEYKGGNVKSIIVNPTMLYDEFIRKVCRKFNVDKNAFKFHFTVKFDPSCLILLDDDASLQDMFRFNECCRIYLLPCSTVEDPVLPPTRASSPVVASSSSQAVCPPENNDTDAQVDVSIHSGTVESHGLSQRCEETQMAPLEFSRFQNAVTGSGQTFPNAAEFRDALYLMSLAGRFRYSFKRNCPRHMSVFCKVEKCPWKITCRAIGASSVVRVHTFRNVHTHSLEDVASSQPLVRTNRASLIIDKVIRSTPNYQPRQICKDFLRQHGVKLSYNQAWQLKEKAKERIHGHPKNYYKLLPWMCEKIVQTNPGTIVELTHSDEGHFEQLFIAHKVCIEGFAKGCRPIIEINSSQMNGPYGGVLFFVTTYDADDCIFPLAFGVMRSENYDDWFWFMQNLKKVVGDRDVVIISNRHPDLLRSVSEIFGADNHAYCYRHLKEDFVRFINNESANGKKGRGNALYWLDSIAHARLDYDYDVAIIELRKVSEDLANWVESNKPEHWAMSKFPKKRWDKITTNLAESLNAWLRNDHHRSICDFLMEHMAKLGTMLNKHKEESTHWNGLIGPNIEEKLITNIAKGKTYTVTPFLHHNYGVCIGKAYLNVDIGNRVCTCKAWQMLEIPCEHACAVLLSIGQDVSDFVDEWYKFPKQELIYSGSFDSIEPHDIPNVDDNGVVRDLTGQILFSLLPPQTKRPPGRPRKRRIECHTTYCSRCHLPGHNRKTCKNTLCSSD